MKTLKETGGPAFARPHSDDRHSGEEGCYAQDGMTLRDYFAAKAMQSWLVGVDDPTVEKCAAFAYEIADAMLDERKL